MTPIEVYWYEYDHQFTGTLLQFVGNPREQYGIVKTPDGGFVSVPIKELRTV